MVATFLFGFLLVVWISGKAMKGGLSTPRDLAAQSRDSRARQKP
jgi:hypothetical protein